MEEPKNYRARLSRAQRRILAEIAPEVVDRLKLDEKHQPNIQFTLDEMRDLLVRLQMAVKVQVNRIQRQAIHGMIDEFNRAINVAQQIGSICISERIFQFKLTLMETKPKIWRRIQVPDCTLDKLHKHIQTSIGWSNLRLFIFKLDNSQFMDSMLLEEDFKEDEDEHSTIPMLSAILDQDGERRKLSYTYNCRDDWELVVVFEDRLNAAKGQLYPLCVEGAGACPPEDIGSVIEYERLLEIWADPEHERHDELIASLGRFDPEAFSAEDATKRMRKGFWNWE